jgi:putative DNA primase/helicase
LVVIQLPIIARLNSESHDSNGNHYSAKPITARFMRCDPFTYQPTFKLTIIGNHEPMLRNVDDAARRRFNIVPFIKKPVQIDKTLAKKLRPEWPGILRWMIDGCVKWQAEGLTSPPTVRRATGSYFESQDIVGQWLEEKCNAEPGNLQKNATSADLFASWSKFAKAAGETPGSRKSFARTLERRGFRSYRKGDKAGTRAWYGIDLVVDPPKDQGGLF